MKHLKTIENTSIKLQIGDYVICDENSSYPDELVEFLNNNIGQVVEFRNDNNSTANSFHSLNKNYNIFVVYNNIPISIVNKFYYHKYINYCRLFSMNEIKVYSSNSKDLEFIIDANKYNI